MATRVDPIRRCVRAGPGGGARPTALLSPRDAAAWSELAQRAAPLIEARLPTEVVADRAVRGPTGWRLASVHPALRKARRGAAAMARRGEVVATDVERFFASVRPEVLARALIGVGMEREDTAVAASMLEGWAEHGYLGLPVGPAASSILANAVLLPVDLSLRGAPFLRWVDDYLLPAEHPLERFDAALEGVGLRRSERKTVRGVTGVWRPPYPTAPGRASA